MEKIKKGTIMKHIDFETEVVYVGKNKKDNILFKGVLIKGGMCNGSVYSNRFILSLFKPKSN